MSLKIPNSEVSASDNARMLTPFLPKISNTLYNLPF